MLHDILNGLGRHRVGNAAYFTRTVHDVVDKVCDRVAGRRKMFSCRPDKSGNRCNGRHGMSIILHPNVRTD